MRYINVILCVVMILFIAVQYNDPDGPMWMLIYLVPALWAGIGGFRPVLLTHGVLQILLKISIAAAAAGTVYFWPKMPGWWHKEVWSQVLPGETAREGMGMMIVAVVLVIVWASTPRISRQVG